MLIAKLAGRAVPGVAWWLVGVDALQGLSQGAREELAARHIYQEAWATDQQGTCRRLISEAETSIRSVLNQADVSLHATVQDHRTAAQQALDETVAVRDSLLSSAAAAEEATGACDRELVSALLSHDGFNPDVSRVHRVPNRSIEVTFAGAGEHKQAIEALSRHLAPETVSSATSNRLPVVARYARKVGRA